MLFETVLHWLMVEFVDPSDSSGTQLEFGSAEVEQQQLDALVELAEPGWKAILVYAVEQGGWVE